jgi:glycine hydroxymethyltransferase
MDSAEALAAALARSLVRQERISRSTLILNPVENYPFADDIAPASGFLHGLYNTDKVRTRAQQLDTRLQFAGRGRIAYDSRRIYRKWAEALQAEDVTLRLLSGLHAHATVFMSCARAGERVLLLPEHAGGHISTKSILERLGLDVIDIVADDAAMKIDLCATISAAREGKPDWIFIDRSEGLVYEDFSDLVCDLRLPAIFDGSQYLTNILAGDFISPFSMGFDYLLATLHKNFPGPQKALLACRKKSERWSEILSGISTFVSNMHVFSNYSAGLAINRMPWLRTYSRNMGLCALALEGCLASQDCDVIHRPDNSPATHHVWIRFPTREAAFSAFESLERCRILVNFRKLPYNLGFGLRLGLNSAVRIGFKEGDAPFLASIIVDIIRDGATNHHRVRARAFNEDIWSRFDA